MATRKASLVSLKTEAWDQHSQNSIGQVQFIFEMVGVTNISIGYLGQVLKNVQLVQTFQMDIWDRSLKMFN